MSMNSLRRCIGFSAIALGVFAQSAYGETICTSADYSGQAGARSYRQVAQSHITQQLQKGDVAQQQGELTAAYYQYAQALHSFPHPDLKGVGNLVGSGGVSVRCATLADYQGAMEKLQGVAKKLAQQALSQGRWVMVEGERYQQFGGTEAEVALAIATMQDWGALDYYRNAYLFQDYQQQFKVYLKKLYGQADAIPAFRALLSINRSNDLKDARQRYERDYSRRGYSNDSIGLLPEEAQGLQVLDNTRDALVAALGDNIDFYLDKETGSFAELGRAQGIVAEMLAAETAVRQLRVAQKYPALIRGVGSYKQEPWYSMAANYEQKIAQQAERQGDQLLSLEKPQAAERLYSVAGARDKRKQASAMAKRESDAMQESLRQSLEKSGDVFDAATDSERQQFKSDTDALADELGL